MTSVQVFPERKSFFSLYCVLLLRAVRHALLDCLASRRSGKTTERRLAELDRHAPSDLAKGAEEGLTVLLHILPSLIALLSAVYMFRASGAMRRSARF